MTLDIGTRLGPYEIVALIGAGGMGEVYRALDTRLDRTVAVKVLHPELSTDPGHPAGSDSSQARSSAEHRARFEREAKAIASLSHPHICTLHDVGVEPPTASGPGRLYLVMEHLEGETLAEHLKRGPLPLPQVCAVAAQIADALDAAHKHGIIHRDLKPGNVMLTAGGTGRPGAVEAKLLDFGLAKLRPHDGRPTPIDDESAPTRTEPPTARGTILGTVQYMAPEQLEGREVDARTDIWALGALIHEMVTGRRAFEATSQASAIGKIMHAEPAPLSTLQPLTPSALERLVARCLAKQADDRWDSAHDVADELRWLAQTTAGTTATLPSHRALHGRRWTAAAALAFVAFAVGTAALRWPNLWKGSPVSKAGPAISSIAVLPLENLSGDPGQEYFADGMTDSLINELAQIRSLRVISRTSVMRYKGTRKPLEEIAHELNDVGAVVEGTVMREGGRVAVTVQLIDTASDAHLWSQSYERDLTDVLTLRREVASSVAREIRAAILPEEARRLARRETISPHAYESYLRALEWQRKGDTADTLTASVNAVREAVSLDPGFAEGFATLAEAHALLWWYHYDRSPERAREARSAADRALALDPDLGAAHRAKGGIHYFLDLDYPRALAELSLALKANPSDTRSLLTLGAVKRRQGNLQETVTYLEQARALDPHDALLAFNLGETLALLRNPDQAERCYDDALRLSPTYNRAFAYKLRWRLRVKPELAQAREVERRAVAAGLGNDTIVEYHRVLLRVLSGDNTGALNLLSARPAGAYEDQFYFVPTALLAAQVHDRAGRRGEARQRYVEARRLAEERLSRDPGDSRVHSALGLALAGLGDKAGAVREGQAGVDGMPVEKEAYRGAYRLEDLARIYVAVGERDKAVEILTRLLSMPLDLAGPALAIDPAWASLRGHPGFERLVVTGPR